MARLGRAQRFKPLIQRFNLIPPYVAPSFKAYLRGMSKHVGTGESIMYPKNAASPERIAVGAVILIADGTVQTSAVSITVVPQGGVSGAGGGTTTYEQGVVFYVPTQAETNYTSFIVTAYKASCIPVSTTVVTTAAATAGQVRLEGVTHTSAVIPTVTTVGTLTTYTGNTVQTGDNFARLGAPAGASVSADVAALKAETVTILADTNDIQTRIPATLVSGRIDASVGAVAANAITAAGIADGAIDRATFAADTGLVTVRSNTAQAGASTTITLDASASAVTDFYKNALIATTGGTGAGQGRYCTAYNGTTKVATVSAWATNPDNTTTFAIIAADAIVGATAPTASQVADEVQTRTIAAVTTVNGLAANVITAASIATDAGTEIATAVLTTQMTESYRADGSAPTLAQGVCETIAHLGESSISGTTKTIKKVDGTTTAATFTLDSATVPTIITRAT